jgi:threonine synthase
MGTFLGYVCSACGTKYAPDEVQYTCPQDGANLDILLDYSVIAKQTDIERISESRDESIWRYIPLLPVRDPGFIGTPLRAVGWTPLFSPDRLSKTLGLVHLWLKDDGRNPTASFKDRASAVVVARAREIGAQTVATASTGNAGAALAGMAAAAGQPAVILAPKSAPPAKVAQLLIFGARVILVDGSYDQAFDLTLQASAELGWYCRNTGYNPFTAEGKKTAAYEICEQLTMRLGPPNGNQGRWRSPDSVFVSVGDGNIISGLHKGFRDLTELGWIDRAPRLFGVQSEGSAAIYNAFKAGENTIQPVQAMTIADSISVDLPRDGLRALRAVRDTGGEYLAVPDAEILSAIASLGRQAAVFAEPAGAAAYAGLAAAAARGLVKPDEQVVCVITGNGLKDVRAGMQAAGQAVVIEPTLEALHRELAHAEAIRHGS